MLQNITPKTRKHSALNTEVTKESKEPEAQKSDGKKCPEKTKDSKEPESCVKRTGQVADVTILIALIY
jgi:hypothetical protein